MNTRCIAHEIRNHLSICELYTQVIKKNLTKEGINNGSIENAINCINKSLKIINNSLLDLKSLDNFSPERCDLKTLINEGIEMSAVYICDKDIQIINKVNQSATVCVDESKFLACIVNIIKNAIEAIEKQGKIKISLNVKNDLAYIRISNNGKEIENKQLIFENGYTTKSNGNGLGLSICVKNLKLQNAQLNLIKSTPELTEFEIILPVII